MRLLQDSIDRLAHRGHRESSDATREAPVGKQRRSDRERGAALVEAAFVTPMLIMLLLGTVTSALAYSEHTSLQTAAREASRFGATLPVNGNLDGWLIGIMDVAEAAGGIDLADTAPGQYICVAYVYPNGAAANDRTSRRVQSAGVTGPLASGPTATCFDDGRPDNERRVQVVTERTTTIQAVLFAVDVNLSTPSAARFERGNS